MFFRTLLFKIFNKESTWELLSREVGEVRWETYDYGAYDRVLSAAFARGERLYSAAYIVPPPQLGEERKHRNHLRLLEMMMTSGAPERVVGAATMRQAYEVLLGYPALGPFLAYQFTIDLNYAPHQRFRRWTSLCQALVRVTASASASALLPMASRPTSSATWPTPSRSISPAWGCPSPG